MHRGIIGLFLKNILLNQKKKGHFLKKRGKFQYQSNLKEDSGITGYAMSDLSILSKVSLKSMQSQSHALR